MDSARLFHAIVISGVAMGCSSEIQVAQGGGAAGADGGTAHGAGGAGGAGGASGSGGQSSVTVVGSGGSTTIASDAGDAECSVGPSLDAGPPYAATEPSDCAYPQQFYCQSYEPTYEGCQCVPDAPLQACDCPVPGSFQCHQYNPQMGCTCVVVISPPPPGQ
jgi:hypothetical protein